MDCAFFPYGLKSKEFLIKRCLYLIEYLDNKCDKIIIACNTLSLLVLPLICSFFPKVEGVFDTFRKEITFNSVVIGTKLTIELVKLEYDVDVIDGTDLIYAIQNNNDYSKYIEYINKQVKNNDKIILACTHFLNIKDNFIIKSIKNI